ncbi:hypothetical protein SDJN02_11240 [Cucurbita argyrosperma subsp. argyrosperma]|nr:hypothetical protein SDJN02_11240 [Cucurbita argyrosperma subsp. argyrosperma]
MASWFNLWMHWLLPEPNRVMDAGKQPIGGFSGTIVARTASRSAPTLASSYASAPARERAPAGSKMLLFSSNISYDIRPNIKNL